MQIVQRSATIPLTSLPFPFPLLTAPPPPKLLAAPKIAGLLPARVPQPAARVQIEIVREPQTFDELMAQLGHLPTVEECDAEIIASLEAHIARTRRSVTSRRSI